MGSEEELDLNMVEISNFVMYNLHSEFFYNPDQSYEEKKFQRKMAVLDSSWRSPPKRGRRRGRGLAERRRRSPSSTVLY